MYLNNIGGAEVQWLAIIINRLRDLRLNYFDPLMKFNGSPDREVTFHSKEKQTFTAIFVCKYLHHYVLYDPKIYHQLAFICKWNSQTTFIHALIVACEQRYLKFSVGF